MTLKKINNFAQTRDAAAFAQAIEARVEGAGHFSPAPAQQWRSSPALKSSVA
jgi:hypothetical protein